MQFIVSGPAAEVLHGTSATNAGQCLQPPGAAIRARAGIPLPGGKVTFPRACRRVSGHALIGAWVPSRSDRRTRMAAIVTISPSSAIPADTSKPRENPVARACW
jgi:hypothetical protein